MKSGKYILVCFSLISILGFSQVDQTTFRFWQLTGLSGQVLLRGNYRQSDYTAYDITRRQSDLFFNGILQLKTKSYFVHPNFCDVKLNFIYNPQYNRDKYLGIPDYTENSNGGGFDFSALFLKKKAFNFSTHAGLNNTIQNIENISRVKSKTRSYGVTANYGNKIIPISASYDNNNITQQTIGSDRVFKLNQQMFVASASKSFSDINHNSITYSHTEDRSSQVDSIGGFPQTYYAINTIDNIDLSDDVAFDKKKNFVFTSNITDTKEHGTDQFQRFQANEHLNCILPANFTFATGYNYNVSQQDSYKVIGQGVQAGLSHRLYNNLTTRLNFEHSDVNQYGTYNQQRNRYTIDFLYTKKIYKGTLSLNYSYVREYQKVVTSSPDLVVLREEYILNTGQIVLLKHPDVNINSIVVRNISGTIIYQLNVDYQLIQHDRYTEILRIPGQGIPNNGSVYIDYTAAQGGTYDYNSNTNSFSGDVRLFKNILDVYYRFMKQNYDALSITENSVLNYYTRHVAGVRLDFNFVKAGVEYEYYNSTVVPYQGMRYYAMFQKSLKEFTFSLNGDLVDYQMTDENARRQDIILSTKVAYSVLRNLRLDADYMFRESRSKGNSLDYHTAKLELTTSIRRLYVSVGGNIYWNQNNNTKTYFKGLFIQVSRNF